LEVGGDWYDVYPLGDGRVALTVGDVGGHGLAAAAAMGQLRTALAALARYTDSPGELLSRLDAFVSVTGATDFATVCYGVLDLSTGSFEYASAGHPPMLLVTPDGGARWLDEAQSAPLWGDGEESRPQATVTLEPDSLLVLYSDGLIERRGELLSVGLDRLMAAGIAAAEQSTMSVCDELMVALGVDESRDDDVAVLAVRFDPRPTEGFFRTFPARPEELRGLRGAMRSWLETHGIPEAAGTTLLLAVGEASSNAVEHAYHDLPAGEVDVEIEQNPDRTVTVIVRDYGTFRPPSESPLDRGRGTRLMRALAEDFDRSSTPNGTTVRFRLALAESPSA
jgi:anti-sigma regulatory factor (Ser/Thr protein kinase)